MKFLTKAVVLFIITALFFQTASLAQETIFYETFSQYTPSDTETIVPVSSRYNNVEVLKFLSAGTGKYKAEAADPSGNICLKSEITAVTTNDSNLAYIFPAISGTEYTKEYFQITFRFKMDSNNRLDFSMRSGNNDNSNILTGADNVLKPWHNNAPSTDSNHFIALDSNEFYTIKLIFDMKEKKYYYYVNGALIGDGLNMRDLSWASLGSYYIVIKHSIGTGTLPAKMLLDYVAFESFRNQAIEISKFPDYYNDGAYSDYLYQSTGELSTAIDVIIRDDISAPLMTAFAVYQKNDEGFYVLVDYDIKKASLSKGINRISGPLISPAFQEGKEGLIKLLMWDSLHNILPYTVHYSLDYEDFLEGGS